MSRRILTLPVALAALLLIGGRADASLLVVENGNNDVLSIDAAGAKTTFASTNINNPIGIGLDFSNQVYVVNADSVAKFSASGSPLGFYVAPGTTSSGPPPGPVLNGPLDIAFDFNNNGYVTNQGNDTVAKFNSAGVYQGFFGSTATTPVPSGIGFDPANSLLYVANTGDNSFSIYNPANLMSGPTRVTPTGAGALDSPQQIAFDAVGNVYIASFGRTTGVSSVQEYAPDGTFLRTIGTTPNTNATGGAEGVAVDKSGNIFVSFLNSGTIEQFNAAGVDQGVFASGLASPAYLQLTPQAVPEPGTFALAGAGLVALAVRHLARRGRGGRRAA